MFKKFNWNGNISQQYTADYGSQFILASSQSALSRSKGNSFTMNAPENELVLLPQVTASGNFDGVNWGQVDVEVQAGRLILDGSALNINDGDTSLFWAPGNMTIGGYEASAGVEVFNAGYLEGISSTTIKIMKNGYLSIENIQNADDAAHKFSLEGNAYLDISSPGGLNVGTCTLSETSRAEIRSQLIDGNGVFTASGSSRLWLYTDAVANGTELNLKDGAEIFLVRNSTPSNLEHCTDFRINFSSNGTGYILLDAVIDSNGTPIYTGYGKNFLLTNNMITINGVTQNDEAKLNFEYPVGYNFMAISLKP